MFDRSAIKESNSDTSSSLVDETPKFRPRSKAARSSMELREFAKIALGKFCEKA